MSDAASDAGRRLERSDGLRRAVRVGLVAYAAVHLLVALLAFRLALGGDGGTADTTGALSALARRPGGQLMLVVMAGGFAALALSRALEGALDARHREGAKAWGSGAYGALKAGLYGFLAFSCAKVAAGQGSDGGSTDTLTARVLAAPGGQLVVAAVGLGITAYALGLLHTGVTQGYRDKLAAEGWHGDAGDAFDALARVGYVAKGLAFALVGALVVAAALGRDPERSGGLDEALHTLLAQPFGRIGVGFVAVGLAAYGVFALARARHLR